MNEITMSCGFHIIIYHCLKGQFTSKCQILASFTHGVLNLYDFPLWNTKEDRKKHLSGCMCVWKSLGSDVVFTFTVQTKMEERWQFFGWTTPSTILEHIPTFVLYCAHLNKELCFYVQCLAVQTKVGMNTKHDFISFYAINVKSKGK